MRLAQGLHKQTLYRLPFCLIWMNGPMPEVFAADYDVAIVGGGPAGLSAAVVLGRARRRVILLDDGRPRNQAARGVHCYLGHDGIAPDALRELGQTEARHYGVELVNARVVAARRLSDSRQALAGFEVQTSYRTLVARTLLLCTGVVDVLPEIRNLREFYGRSAHHCPYCDGWEHRDERLAAFGKTAKSAVELALSLRTWSPHVTACSHGECLTDEQRERLARNEIAFRQEPIVAMRGSDGVLKELAFDSGPPLQCDALFFGSDQFQRSPLAAQLGIELDDENLVRTGKKQNTRIRGLFLAGDADGEVQFAIVAAAEGAVAGVAINHVLQEDDRR
jgi:thioredoxin reductase